MSIRSFFLFSNCIPGIEIFFSVLLELMGEQITELNDIMP